jgi:hypothetical protein
MNEQIWIILVVVVILLGWYLWSVRQTSDSPTNRRGPESRREQRRTTHDTGVSGRLPLCLRPSYRFLRLHEPTILATTHPERLEYLYHRTVIAVCGLQRLFLRDILA